VVIPDGPLVLNATGLHVLVLQQNGTVKARPINIYRDFGTTAELHDGLSGGEVLVLNPPVGLGDGAKVHVPGKTPA
jgi:HlyD family secretion protein